MKRKQSFREEVEQSQLANMYSGFGMRLTKQTLKLDLYLTRRVRELYMETVRSALTDEEHIAKLDAGLFRTPKFKSAPTEVKAAVHGALQVMFDMLYQSLDGSASPLAPVRIGPDGRIFGVDGEIYALGDPALPGYEWLHLPDGRIRPLDNCSAYMGESLEYRRASQTGEAWRSRWLNGEVKYFHSYAKANA